MSWRRLAIAWLWLGPAAAAAAWELGLPTANDAVLRPGGEAAFFQPTVTGAVESGMFGCVRQGGTRFHEGVDIRALQRDRQGESTDPVTAVSDGEVAFINERPGLSNYGRYVVLQHRWEQVTVYTLYAHLREVTPGLVSGQPVVRGQRIGTLGRSTNTREGISRDRAHLHFEINFMLNPQFRVWYPKRDPKAPPFGNFNGQNFVGIDPVPVFRGRADDPNFSFRDHLARQPIAFTALVGARPFPWLTTHRHQVQPFSEAARAAARAGEAPVAVAYEIGFTGWGLPVAIWPRTETEITGLQRRTMQRGLPLLHMVSASEIGRNGCRGLVGQAGRQWEFTARGRAWMDLLTYSP
jgi:murein DD-endopeptidase MepM/ murein hydrolase activator NlpD